MNQKSHDLKIYQNRHLPELAIPNKGLILQPFIY